ASAGGRRSIGARGAKVGDAGGGERADVGSREEIDQWFQVGAVVSDGLGSQISGAAILEVGIAGFVESHRQRARGCRRFALQLNQLFESALRLASPEALANGLAVPAAVDPQRALAFFDVRGFHPFGE